jgi:hypothetical protein
MGSVPRSRRERADARIRTADPFITNEVLYQLSYAGVATEAKLEHLAREWSSIGPQFSGTAVNSQADLSVDARSLLTVGAGWQLRSGTISSGLNCWVARRRAVLRAAPDLSIAAMAPRRQAD